VSNGIGGRMALLSVNADAADTNDTTAATKLKGEL
jgi:hypothetical protein